MGTYGSNYIRIYPFSTFIPFAYKKKQYSIYHDAIGRHAGFDDSTTPIRRRHVIQSLAGAKSCYQIHSRCSTRVTSWIRNFESLPLFLLFKKNFQRRHVSRLVGPTSSWSGDGGARRSRPSCDATAGETRQSARTGSLPPWERGPPRSNRWP